MSTFRSRVGFVDDHPALIQGLVGLFSDSPDYEVVSTGSNAMDALKIAQSQDPDILFMDLSMPGEVFATIKQIMKDHENTNVIVYTAFSGVDFGHESTRCRCDGLCPQKRSGRRALHCSPVSVAQRTLYHPTVCEFSS